MSQIVFFGRNSVVNLILLAAVSIVGIVGQSQKAEASCGDYLHHSPSSKTLLGLSISPTNEGFDRSLPSPRCRNGNCRSQDSTPLPVKSQLRTVQDRPEMTLGKFEVPTIHFLSSRLVSDEQLVIQPAYDIAEPPPRG